jgi:hypothetical protein
MVIKALYRVRYHVDEHGAQVPGYSDSERPNHSACSSHAYHFVQANLFVHLAKCIAMYKDNAHVVAQVVGIVHAVFSLSMQSFHSSCLVKT